ncbi:hypothetical protein [Halorussus sp. MSC15.2]|uniref:hypothetical protein n=1 Tax=Halorussus sp. MSC15.2 TaxID=2283638 RepID=UPI0013D21A01|nr:hypothetical protein [Halorussus sp. MSC15.2]NEU56227.1 hypothetical protein [Halorussus sp. MSC15.2]
MRRRRVLLGATTVATALAGCSVQSSRSPMLDLVVFNHTDSPYTVEMGLFRGGGDATRAEARASDERIDVEPQGRAQRENVAETRPYVVRYNVYENNRRMTDEDHVHYYPEDDADGDSLAFDIGSEGTVTRR